MHLMVLGSGKKHPLVPGALRGSEKNTAGDSRVSHHIQKKEIIKRNDVILLILFFLFVRFKKAVQDFVVSSPSTYEMGTVPLQEFRSCFLVDLNCSY
jgi:hypothetical protein